MNSKTERGGEQGLDRRDVVARILRDRRELVVVTGLGAATYDVSAAGDHPRNFYLWGAMGGASMVALGLALARPDVPVCAITGDGEMLMGLGSLATIGVQAPHNLSIVVLENGIYGETGGQAAHTSTVADLAAVARGCGIATTMVVSDEAGVAKLAGTIGTTDHGPTLATVKINQAEPVLHLPSRDGAWLATRLKSQLGGFSL